MSTTENAQEKAKQPGLKSLLRNRNFRMLWLGQIVSDFGDSLTNLALLIIINQLTGSAAALATMLIMLTIPQVTFGLVAGVYVDRWNRKTVMIASDIVRGVLVLGFIFVSSVDLLWLMYLIGFVQASVGTLFTPARGALLPNLVERDSLLPANSISQSSRIIFNVLGTAAAGVLVAATSVVWPAFVVDAVTFVVAALFISRIRVPAEVARPAAQAAQASGMSAAVRAIGVQLREGMGLIVHSRLLSGTLVAAAVTMLGLGAVNVLMVPLIINDMGLPATWFGVVEFAQVSSMVAAGGLVAVLAAKVKPANIISVALVALGGLIALMSAASNIYMLIGILFLAGWFITPLNASIATIVQTAVDDNARGRTGAALNTLVSTASLLSMALAGVLAEGIGVRNVFIAGGALAVLAGIASAFVFRQRAVSPGIAGPETAPSVPAEPGAIGA
jgi:DHA3 family macrolide efflux protein-like MFS transporter